MGVTMKKFFIYISILSLWGSLSAIDISGTQSGTWDPANNPHNLIGDVVVPVGSELNIMPGVVLNAMGNYRINAEGTIQAIGTATDSIYFLNAQDPPTNMWKGIRLENESQQSNFLHVVVEYAEYGINAVDSPLEVSYSRFSYNQRGLHLYGIGNSDPAAMNVHHNIIEHTMQNGILIPQNSNAWIHHNEVRYNGTVTQYYGAIQLSNQSAGGQNNPIIEYNYIHDNHKQGITAWDIVGASAINPIIRYNDIEGNLTGIYLLNASGIVHNNMIINNFIPGDANSGAGMMISGATSLPYVAENTLTGNFTGLYITTNAQPVLGDLAENHPWAYGMNVIRDNIDGSGILHSVVCASYSAAENVIKAENNDWGVYTPDEIALGIMDHNDSTSLPTVDFEPWFESPSSITISGSFTWDEEDYAQLLPQDLQLQLIDLETREIVETHPLESNPFSFESEIASAFYVLLSGVDPVAEIWASVGALDEPVSFNPADGDVELGELYINAWQHFDTEITGAGELVEGHEVFPVHTGFLFLNFDRTDYFYDEGSFRYIYKHEYRDEEGWHTINFPWGTQYARILNINPGDEWDQTCVQHGEIKVNIVSYDEDDNGRGTYTTIPTQGEDYSSRRFVDEESDLLYINDPQGYCYMYYELVEVGEFTRLKYYKPNLERPHELSLASYDEGTEQQFSMHFWWQAPAFSGVEYTEYRLYMQHQGGEPELLDSIDYTATPGYYVEHLTGSGLVDFWVVASDGTTDSELSNIITFNFPVSNDDLVQAPELRVYPNPVKFFAGGALHLEVKGMRRAALSIYNIRGQKVVSAPLSEDQFSWNGKDAHDKTVGSGIYFLRIEDQDKKVLNRKIIVTK